MKYDSLFSSINYTADLNTGINYRYPFFHPLGTERETQMNLMQCIFTGPPRVGKSSYLMRLMGIIPERLLASTDIISLEGTIRLNIQGSCGFAMHISELGWKKLQIEEEMQGFVGLITQHGGTIHTLQILDELFQSGNINIPTEPAPKKLILQAEPTKEVVKSTNIEKSYVHEATSAPTQQESSVSGSTSSLPDEADSLALETKDIEKEYTLENVPTPSQVLEQALITMRQADATKSIDSASFVYFTDTGGQPEFQELLPLLITSCNAVHIIFNLEVDLYSYPPLEYLPSIDEPPICYESPYTVREMLCQSLANVPIPVGENIEGESVIEKSSMSNAVLFIGTHKDTVSSQKIQEMNDNLINMIKDTPQYKAQIVKYSSPGNIIFPVNNFSSLQNDEEFIPIRRVTQNLVYGECYFKVKAPTSWLFLGIVLQKLSDSQPIITLEQCREIARQCGISQSNTEEVVKFLHFKIGAIRFYDTKNLNKVVILKPQLIINLLSRLIKRQFRKLQEQRMIFTNNDIKDVVKDSTFVREGFMLCLTHDLLLSVPHPHSTIQNPKHLLTCMLPMNKQEENDDTAVFFTLKSNFLPSGVGRATLTAVMQHASNITSRRKIIYQQMFRNSLKFIDHPSETTFQIKYTNQCLSLSILNIKNTGINGISFQVRRQVEAIMKDVLKLYNYGEKSILTTFICPQHNVEMSLHYAVLTPEGYLECQVTKEIFKTPQKLRHWLPVSMQLSSISTFN